MASLRIEDQSLLFLESAPCPVHWAGWQSDTLTMQRNGWMLAVEKDTYRGTIRLAATHRARNAFMVSDPVEIRPEFVSGRHAHLREMWAPIQFHMSHFAGEVTIVCQGNEPAFVAIDAEPRYVRAKEKRLVDLDIFRPITSPQAEEILIEKADMTVIEHLEAIKNLQSDRQRELREQARRAASREQGDRAPEEAPESQVVVQLVNYARRARA